MDGQPKKLYRSTNDKMIAGVCGGLGEYFNIDPVIFRLLFVALVIGAGSGVLFYVILWVIVPQKPVETPPSNPVEN